MPNRVAWVTFPAVTVGGIENMVALIGEAHGFIPLVWGTLWPGVIGDRAGGLTDVKFFVIARGLHTVMVCFSLILPLEKGRLSPVQTIN